MKEELKSLEGLENNGFMTQTEKELQDITGGSLRFPIDFGDGSIFKPGKPGTDKPMYGVRPLYGVEAPLLER